MTSTQLPSDFQLQASDHEAIPIGTVVPYDMVLDRELRRFSKDVHGFDQLDLLFTRPRTTL